MDLENATALRARLFRTAIDDDRVAASLVARITYDIKDGALVFSEEQAWPVSSEPWLTEYGVLDTDQLFYRGGVDLFVFGRARPEKSGTTMMNVSVRAGDFSRDLVVFGVRVWHRRISGLVATSPRPIEAIPLTMAYAFGGKDQWEGLDIAYPLNADGIGFYLNEGSAIDKPLPNIEEPDQLVTKWDDRPIPGGVTPCPPASPIRLHELHGKTEGGPPLDFNARFFNAAHPRMVAPAVAPGSPICVTGVSASGPLSFNAPTERPRARIRFDDEEIVEPLAIDQIGIEVEKQRVFISYRFPFRYVVYPEQLRSCRLEA